MRTQLKRALGALPTVGRASGATFLIYHRVGGGSPDERDVTAAAFAQQVEHLATCDVVPISTALRRLRDGDARPSVVLTFDDGFEDVHRNAWPLLREAQLPFTLYLATGYLGATMHWDGSTARDTGAPALSWDQVVEMAESGLATIGNHTHDHVRPELLEVGQLDRCSEEIEQRLGRRPEHFAYTWGIPVPRLEEALRSRFASAVTGELGRNAPGADPLRLRRVPVRGSDPLAFFAAKTAGALVPERLYARAVSIAKTAGARA